MSSSSRQRRSIWLLCSLAFGLAVTAIGAAWVGAAGAEGHEAPGGPVGSRSMTAGFGHSCVIDDEGDVRCWGYNEFGQLGLGDTDNRGDAPGEMGDALPIVDLGSGRTATDVSAGGTHTCAILDDASVKCWGGNDRGQLGLGDTEPRGDEAGEMGDALPSVNLGTGRTATAISAGPAHTCVVLDNGTVKCWGRNGFGRLGLGDTDDRGDGPGEMGDLLPAVDLGTDRSATVVVAAGAHSCAVLDNGRAKCWGINTEGQLGIGATDDRGDEPGEMGDALPAVGLGAGRTITAMTSPLDSTCVVLDDGSVKCWGANFGGQLGYGDTAHRGDQAGEMGSALPPVDLGTGRTAAAISGGYGHTCTLLDNGAVKCWGANDAGQLGLGDTDGRGDGPGEMGNALLGIDLGDGRRAAAISAGSGHTCVLLGDGMLKCWGANDDGQLGLGDAFDRGDDPGEMGDALPRVDVPLLTRAVAPRCAGREATIVGRGGQSRIVGTPGPDVIVTLDPDGVTILGRGGNDIICGGPGDDIIRGGAGRDLLIGGGGNDTLNGNAGNDRIRSGAGRDLLIGGGGNDTLHGNAGNDRIRGGAGRDLLVGGPGRDTCDGGPGRDRARTCESTTRVP